MAKFEKLDLASDAIVREIAGGMYAIGSLVATHAQQLITAGSVSGKHHVASSPGEPPNNDTGGLASGIEVQQLAPLKVQVVSTARYSIPLEHGTSKMGARPFLAPAREATRREAQQIAVKLVNRALRKHFRR